MTIREKGLCILLLCVAVLSAFYFKGRAEEEKQKSAIVAEKKDTRFADTFGKIAVVAKAAYVYDLADKRVLFTKNENEALPLASLTKVMTALTALRVMPGESAVAISPEALLEEGDAGLFANESWKLLSLVQFTLVSSSNDAAKAIGLALAHVLPNGGQSNEAFVAQMNQEAASMGLVHTHFINETGLDAEDLSSTGGTGTAKEMTEIFIQLLKEYPDVFSFTAEEKASFVSLDGFRHTVKNTNSITGTIPVLVASKTGFTDLAGGNLVIVFSAGLEHPIAVTVLGSTVDGRFTDVQNLIETAINYIAWK